MKRNLIYIILFIEHKTKVEYKVALQILRYIVHIWEGYGNEKEDIRKEPTKVLPEQEEAERALKKVLKEDV